MIIDGRKISSDILNNLKLEVAALPFQPVFCDVLVGDGEVAASYVRIKARSAEQVGMKFRHANLPATISQKELMQEIKNIAAEPNMCGLIVQLPLPRSFDRKAVLGAVPPAIDVDCMGGENLDAFYSGDIRFVPPTAAAIMHILDGLNLDLPKKKILVLGQGELVGRPVSFLLRRRNLPVDVADRSTANTLELMKAADIIISATGDARFITGDKINPGAVVIDAGTSEALEGNIVGDADFGSVSPVASVVSPVPGGVGPVTVAMLLQNVVKAAKLKSIK